MMKRHLWGLCFALMMGSVQAATIDGVTLPDSIDLAGKRLVLNGAGVRIKVLVKVYVAGFYVEQKSKDPNQLFSQPGPKRISLTMVRDVDTDELGRLFIRGMEDNTKKADQGRLLPSFLTMSQFFAKYKKVNKGDVVMIDWVPGKGMTLYVRGNPEETGITDPDFMTAMMSIWLGPQPADWALKEALLGKPVEAPARAVGRR